MKKQNVKRLIVLTNVAARDPSDRPSFYNRVLLTLFTLIRGKIAKDSAEEARIISESDPRLDYSPSNPAHKWTIDEEVPHRTV